jgi:toxin ParE1/3/4
MPANDLSSMPRAELRLVISDDARADFEDAIIFSIEQWGREVASDYAAQIDAVLENLKQHPHAGRARNEYFPGCRSVVAGKHLIYYEPLPGRVRVLRILHERVDATPRLSGRRGM